MRKYISCILCAKKKKKSKSEQCTKQNVKISKMYEYNFVQHLNINKSKM